MAERLSIFGLCLFSGSHGSYYCAIYLLGKCCCFANESLDTSSRAKPTSCQTPVKSNISNNVGPVKPFFEQTSPFTPRSGLVRFVDLCIDDHGSFVIFGPTQTSLRSNFDHYFFKLRLQGAGCPTKWTVFYFTPCPVPSCPAYEQNSNEGEYYREWLRD
jgi:hypothetical protein